MPHQEDQLKFAEEKNLFLNDRRHNPCPLAEEWRRVDQED